jgi:hypothetical protein
MAPTVFRLCAIVLTVLVAHAALRADAAAQEVPTLAFVDDRDQTLTVAALSTSGATPPLVEVRSLSTEEQTIELRIVGAELSAALVVAAPSSAVVKPGDTAEFHLALTDKRPTASRQGELVALGARGITRRKLSLQVEPGPDAAVNLTDRQDTLTFAAVNYVPTPMSYVFMGVLTLCFAAAAYAFWAGVRPSAPNSDEVQEIPATQLDDPDFVRQLPILPKWRWSGGVVPGFISLLLLVFGGWGVSQRLDVLLWPSPLVSVGWVPTSIAKPLYTNGPITALQNDSPKAHVVGVLAGSDGTLATVLSNDSLIGPSELPRAGRYEGKLGLDATDPTKQALKVVVNVADWWVYAAVALAAGVGVGYRVTRYYATDIQLQRLRVRLAQSWMMARKAQQPFEGEAVFGAADRMDGVIFNKLREIRERLAQEDAAAATTLLTALDAYRDNFVRMLVKLRLLRDRTTEFRALNPATVFNLDPARDVTVLNEIDRVLRQTFDADLEDGQGTYLTSRTSEIDALRQWLEATWRVYEQIASFMQRAEHIGDGRLRVAFREIGIAGLIAANEDGLNTAVKALPDQVKALVNAERPIVVPQAPEAPLGNGGEQPPGAEGRVEPFPAPVPAPEPVAGEPLAAAIQRFLSRLAATQATEFKMTAISGLLAVASGLLAVYLTTPAWGAPGDYLKALLWGSVVSEGAKAVTKIAARQWPFGS